MTSRLIAYLRAHHVALLALFVALGGTSYAAIKLPKNSVGTRQIKNGAVTGAKVKAHSLLAKDFKAGQLPAGTSGPKGDTGPQGPPGLSAAPAGSDLASGSGAVLSGRMKNMDNIVPDYGAASGTSTVSTTESDVSTLSPDRNLVARDLSVRVTAAPDPSQRVFTLVVNGTKTGLTCTIGGPATACHASGPVSVPADSTLSLEDEVPGVATPTADALFGFRLTSS